MIEIKNNVYALHTARTSYIMRVTESGHLEHLYYGRRINFSRGQGDGSFVPENRGDKRTVPLSPANLFERREFPYGNTAVYSEEYPTLVMQDLKLELSAPGKGDQREKTIELIYADGSSTSDFTFLSARENGTPEAYDTLPCSYADEAVPALEVVLYDRAHGSKVVLSYTAYEAEDVITRRTRVYNESEHTFTIGRVLSGQLDLPDSDYILSTFNGAWAREMTRADVPLIRGRHVGGSNCGASSATANPFFMLSRAQTTEDAGEAYGFNLVYSGNHYEAAEVSEFGKTRIVWGINPDTFSWQLAPGETFEVPEAVMTYAANGFNDMSGNMHGFVRKHIVRGSWRDRERPVLLNSWEANYFDINESKLLRLAKAGKDVGIELFVMDDGWFAKRDDDTSSLGDWKPNKSKLPGGISGLAEKIHELGMGFGIWVEPEMVNVKSELYKKHPDWTLEVPGQPHSEGRNQRVLDLSKTEVQDYLIKSMSYVFAGGMPKRDPEKNPDEKRTAPVDYVKWDMNRNMTDVFSQGLSARKQGEVAHRYMLGLYRVMKELTRRFPRILFEGCASGGNRFDLGILSYFPQIWGSDDTDAIERAQIQNGYSYGYPLSTVGAHVSGVPNHQTLRVTPLSTRFAVASFGVLGYECNLCDLKKEELEQIKAQIELYKNRRKLFFEGRFYRGKSFTGQYADRTGDGNVTEWTVVSPDQKQAVAMLLQKQAVPNMQNYLLRLRGLAEDKCYLFTGDVGKLSIKLFGDLVNTVAPVHIRQDSAAHAILSHFVKLDGEKEEIRATGDSLMYAGVSLAPAYGGTGFNDKTRVFPDYAARLYFIEESE